MKNNFKLIKLFFAGVLATVAFSCTDESTFPLPLSELQGEGDNAGAYVRVLEYDAGEFDFFTLDQGQYGFSFEAVDSRGGDLIDKVDVSVRFSDGTVPTDADGNPIEAEDLSTELVQIATITKAEMTETSEAGYPIGSWSMSLPAIVEALGLDIDTDLNGFDAFIFEWELTLTNGKTFDRSSVGLNVSGPYFNSPFIRRVNVICALTEGFATGEYLLEQTEGGPQDPFFGTGDRFASEIVTLEIGEASTQRNFLVNFITFADLEFTIDLLCGQVIVPFTPSGIGCGAPLAWESVDVTAEFDASDDSVITVTFVDDVDGACGLTAPLTFTLTRQ